jgi:hypothetical protein
MALVKLARASPARLSFGPRQLLETEPNRNALASAVQHDLCDGNPDGWSAYVALMQKKVA